MQKRENVKRWQFNRVKVWLCNKYLTTLSGIDLTRHGISTLSTLLNPFPVDDSSNRHSKHSKHLGKTTSYNLDTILPRICRDFSEKPEKSMDRNDRSRYALKEYKQQDGNTVRPQSTDCQQTTGVVFPSNVVAVVVVGEASCLVGFAARVGNIQVQ